MKTSVVIIFLLHINCILSQYVNQSMFNQQRNININNNNINVNQINNNNLNDNLDTNFNRNYQYTSYGGSPTNNNFDLIDQNLYCPEYWMTFRQSCYRFIKSPKRSWLEAKKICQANNGNLANIDTSDKHSFIIRLLLKQNQRQNRYFVSARQTSLNNWVNDDNSPFIPLTDGLLSLDEENEYDKENRNELYNNRNYQSVAYDRALQKDRLVYGFSRTKDRWVFIPTYDFELNLYICESAQLYNQNNINQLADSKRTYDYGFEIIDKTKIPRGPYFIRQPRDTIFDISRRKIKNEMMVKCLAGGYPTPTYQWFKEDYVNDSLTYTRINSMEDSRYTLSGGNLIVFNPEQRVDQGTYHCIAQNKFGRILSESVQLNFGFIMEFNLKRSPETSDLSWGKSIFCDPPQHFPSVKYYWARDFFPNFVDEDQRVFVSYDGALYFSAVESVDRANYSCTVQSTASDTGRTGPFFPLRAKPTQNYQDIIFANSFPKIFPEAPVAGKDIRLECMAYGYPVPNYNWTRRDGGLPRNSQILSYNRVLVIKNATINDNGEYICTVFNNRKSLTKSLSLNIQMIPVFTIPLRDKIKDYNSEVSFTCEAFSVPDSNYTWYKNAEKLTIDNVDRDKYTIQDNILTIKYLDPEKDDGMYQCRAENQLHSVYSSAQLRVLSMKPSFKKRPLESEIYAIYNGNTTITCDPEAAPRPKYTWKKDGNVVGAGGHRRILPTGTLVISPTSRDDEGVYTCVATNSYGTDESHSRLIVLQELRFIQTLRQRIISNVGDYLFLHCDVIYDELLDVAFIWTHNGERILHDEEKRTFIDYNTLEIHNISLLDTGDYECIAKSAVNQISSKTNLIVQGPPGAPGGVKVYDVKKTSVVLEWVDGAEHGRTILFYNILGRTNWNKTWVNVSEGVIAEYERYSGRKRAQVTNLNPWSGYEFSVCAVNDLGVGIPSAPSPLFNTLNDLPYIAPRNVGGGGGKIGDLTIKWEPLKPQEQNSKGIHYKVFWRLHEKEIEWMTKIVQPPGGENVGKAVVHIPLDNYYTKYDVKVQAINDVGSGPDSEVEVIYSAEDMPQVSPQQTYADSFNSTALNVTWLPVDTRREIMRGRIIGHRLKYWKKNLHEEDSVYYLSRTTRNWALIVGLEPDTFYFVKVMVYNAAGEGPESERFLQRTYRKAPQKPPSSVFVDGINPSTVHVTWRYVSPAMDEEPVSGFKVRVWEADQDMATANDTFVDLGGNLECYIDKLTPGKSYKLRVLAYSNGGDGRMSSPTHHFQMGRTDEQNHSSIISPIDFLLVNCLLYLWYMINRSN